MYSSSWTLLLIKFDIATSQMSDWGVWHSQRRLAQYIWTCLQCPISGLIVVDGIISETVWEDMWLFLRLPRIYAVESWDVSPVSGLQVFAQSQLECKAVFGWWALFPANPQGFREGLSCLYLLSAHTMLLNTCKPSNDGYQILRPDRLHQLDLWCKKLQGLSDKKRIAQRI